MVDRKTRKVLIIGFPIFCFMLIALSVYVRNQSDLDPRTEAADNVPEIVRVSEDKAITGVPRVVSADPLTATEGESFTYYIEVVDTDSSQEEISLGVNQVPDWMEVDSGNLVLSGIPRIGVSDTQEVSLFLTDGINQVEHNFYLLILPQNE